MEGIPRHLLKGKERVAGKGAIAESKVARQHEAPAGVETRVSVAWSRTHNLSHVGDSMGKAGS